MPRHPYPFPALTILIPLLAASCTTRFIADFEADTNGALPDTHPAGAPDDRISVLDFGPGGPFRVSNVDPLDGTQSLRVTGPGGREAFFYSDRMTMPDERKHASFAGRHAGSGAAEISLFAGHFVPLGGVRFEGGRIFAIRYPATGDPVATDIGSYHPDAKHSVLMNVDRATRNFEVSVVGGGTSSAPRSLPIDDPWGTASVFPLDTLGMRAKLINGDGDSSYTLDSIRMSERDPD